MLCLKCLLNKSSHIDVPSVQYQNNHEFAPFRSVIVDLALSENINYCNSRSFRSLATWHSNLFKLKTILILKRWTEARRTLFVISVSLHFVNALPVCLQFQLFFILFCYLKIIIVTFSWVKPLKFIIKVIIIND